MIIMRSVFKVFFYIQLISKILIKFNYLKYIVKNTLIYKLNVKIHSKIVKDARSYYKNFQYFIKFMKELTKDKIVIDEN